MCYTFIHSNLFTYLTISPLTYLLFKRCIFKSAFHVDLNTCPERPMFMHSPVGLHIHKPIRTNPHVHVEAIFTANHEYPTVFSSAGLHTLRSKDLTFPSGFTCTLNSQLICLSTYPHTYLPENKSTCSSWCFPSADHEDLPSTIHLHQYMPTDTLIHQPTCSFWSFHSNQPVISTCPSTDTPTPLPGALSYLFQVNIHAYLSTHLLV